MSAQALNIMLVDLFRSDEALTRYQQDPDAVAADYGLSAEERERLKAKEMGWLYTHGGISKATPRGDRTNQSRV